MDPKAVNVLLKSHLQSILLDPDRLLSLARYMKEGGSIRDLAVTLGQVMEGLELLNVDRQESQATGIPGPSPGAEAAKKWTWSPLRIPWKNAEGPKGSYERAKDLLNPEFKELVKDLVEHHGNLTRDSIYYWLFSGGDDVGRKKAIPRPQG